MIVKPRGVPRFKAECIQAYEGTQGQEYIRSYLHSVNSNKSPHSELLYENQANINDAIDLSRRLALGMRVSENYYVSREISTFVETAASNLPSDEDFQRWDLPAEHGFIYLEESLITRDVHLREVATRVLVWNVQEGVVQTRDYMGNIVSKMALGVNVSLYHAMHGTADKDHYHNEEVRIMKEAVEKHGQKRVRELMKADPPMRLWATTFAPFGSPPAHMMVQTEEGYMSLKDTGFLVLENWLRVFWKFVRTEIPALEQTLTPAPKSDVRFMRRMDMQHGTTTVITLRRRTPSGKTGDSHLEFSHRFMVRGHWAKRRCGEQHKDVRYVYIQPYIKGPEDKPLRANHEIIHKVSR